MKNRYPIILSCLALLIGSVLPTSAAEKRRVEVKPKVVYQSAEHRIALVIGNANYRIGSLRNPANDARAIAAALRELGFEVDEQINLSYQDMGRAVNRFGKSIRRDSVALFYYAGHGLQVQGSNYLVPVDMEIQDEGEVQFNTVNAGQVLAKMEEAKNPVNIVILDACRDNPYARIQTVVGQSRIGADGCTRGFFCRLRRRTRQDRRRREGEKRPLYGIAHPADKDAGDENRRRLQKGAHGGA
jgi:hypothetical protein